MADPTSVFIAVPREQWDDTMLYGLTTKKTISAARSHDAACRLRYHTCGETDLVVLRVFPEDLVVEPRGVGYRLSSPYAGCKLHIPPAQLRQTDYAWPADRLDEAPIGGFLAVSIRMRDRLVVVACCLDEKESLAQHTTHLMCSVLHCQTKDEDDHWMTDAEWEHMMDQLAHEPSFSHLSGFQCREVEDCRRRTVIVGVGVGLNATQKQRGCRMAIALAAAMEGDGHLPHYVASNAEFMDLLESVREHAGYVAPRERRVERDPPLERRVEFDPPREVASNVLSLRDAPYFDTRERSGEEDVAPGQPYAHRETFDVPLYPQNAARVVPPPPPQPLPAWQASWNDRGAHQPQDNVWGHEQTLHVYQIRYSVSTIPDRFRDGRHLEELVDKLVAGDVDPLNLVLQVFSNMRNGVREYYTKNNKLLRCLHRYQDKMRHTRWEVWVNVECVAADQGDLSRYFERFDPKWDGDVCGLEVDVVPAPGPQRWP